MMSDHHTLIAKALYGSQQNFLRSTPNKVESDIQLGDLLAWVFKIDDEYTVRLCVITHLNSQVVTARYIDAIEGTTYFKSRLLSSHDLYLLNNEPGLTEFVELLDWSVQEFDPLDPEAAEKKRSLSVYRQRFRGILFQD